LYAIVLNTTAVLCGTHVTGCRLSEVKKENEQRLSELDSLVKDSAGQSVHSEREKVQAAVSEAVSASVEPRLTQLQQQMRQDTADKCLQLQQVSTPSYVCLS